MPTPGSIGLQLRATSLHRALLVLGDWWTVLLIRESFLGVRLFDDFQQRLAIPRQTLTNRLRELVRHEILCVRPYQQRPLRHEYRLTPKGLDLYPYALLLWKWQRRWGQRSVNRLPDRLVHRVCGQSMEPVFACGHCRRAVTIRDVDWHEAPPARLQRLAEAPAPRATRHTVTRSVREGSQLYRHGAYVVADRWTHLILSAGYLGITTFDGFERELGIAPNTLAQRLRLLVDARLLDKRPDPDDSRRHRYRLTDRSRDLFPISMSLLRWADRWMPSEAGPPMVRVHRACGRPLDGVVVCSACAGTLAPHDVRFESDALATA